MVTRGYCYCCMSETDFQDGICPVCGNKENSVLHPAYMKPGTDLHGRYTVGILIGSNDEGANYIAYDKELGIRVLIREFMPLSICTRVKGKSLIGISYNHLAEYKALMAEFTELNRNLARFRGFEHIITILEMFVENNTTYVVTEYVEGITLTGYLRENAGELTWEKARNMFPSLFDSIAKIHEAGIIHRGLCPGTIFITDKGEFRISGFSISAIRTKGAELEPEIFDGYAAPEQYSPSERQGTRTDVYSLCAIMYRVLTGCKPASALDRIEKDNLSSPHEVNPNIPEGISTIIMRGLNLSGDDRIQTVDELSSYLFKGMAGYMNSEDEFTNDYDTNSRNDIDEYMPESDYVDGYDDNYSYTEERKPVRRSYRDDTTAADKLRIPVLVAVILLVILLGMVFFFISKLNFSSNNNANSTLTTAIVTEATTEVTTTEDSGDSTMPNIVGKDYDTVNSWATQNEWFTLSAEYVYSDEYDDGIITWQQIKEGENFETGSTIKVKVSKGSQFIELPSYSGLGYSAYSQKLAALGIPYELSGKTDTGYSDGTVVGTSYDGTKYDLESGETVTIYYAYTPETLPPETEAPTEYVPDYGDGDDDNSGDDGDNSDDDGGQWYDGIGDWLQGF